MTIVVEPAASNSMGTLHADRKPVIQASRQQRTKPASRWPWRE
jgi:hypothetical protein